MWKIFAVLLSVIFPALAFAQSPIAISTCSFSILGSTALPCGATVLGLAGLTGGVDATGGTVTGSQVNSIGNIQLGAGGIIIFNTRARLASPADGTLNLTNSINGNTVSFSNPAANTFQHGLLDSGTPVAQTLRFQNGSGTNIAGVNDTIIGSLGTGTGTNGDLIIQTGVKTTTGSTKGTATTAITVKGETQQVNFAGQLNVAAMTQTAAAQSGTVCYNTGTGAVTYDATLGCLASLASLKTDMKPLRGALDEVMRLRPIEFRFKDEVPTDHKMQVGFTADDTEKVDQRLVGYDADGNLRGVRYAESVALLAAAIQEMNACRLRVMGACWF